MWTYRARVLRVVDADTLHLDVDLGLDVSARITARIVGVNAPELRTVEGVDAARFVSAWLAAAADPAGWVTVSTVKDRREKYGRYLADVTATDGTTLAAALLAAGHAVAYNP